MKTTTQIIIRDLEVDRVSRVLDSSVRACASDNAAAIIATYVRERNFASDPAVNSPVGITAGPRKSAATKGHNDTKSTLYDPIEPAAALFVKESKEMATKNTTQRNPAFSQRLPF